MNKQMFYFGTSLDSAGHYFWELNDQSMNFIGSLFEDLPFNPEDYPKQSKKGFYNELGTVQYYYLEGGWSIMAIEGSCADNRHGSKSVFFSKDYSVLKLGFDGFVRTIREIPIGNKIIESLPFEVKF